ncbi:hypothetical protein Fot_50616 [Forsythia ovata]|uniref:Uncharacterized protein n=1 Tax=Forsythia ovata TaxID=205694 RepID=A0ABD1PYP3_9LAMI
MGGVAEGEGDDDGGGRRMVAAGGSLHLSIQMVNLAIKLGHLILECFINNNHRRWHFTAIVKLGCGTIRMGKKLKKKKTPMISNITYDIHLKIRNVTSTIFRRHLGIS